MRKTSCGLITFAILALVVPIMSAQHVRAATVTATNFTDRANGACATTGTGDCTLREAVIFGNANPGTVITLLAGKYALTIGPSGNDDATTGDLNITGNVTMGGTGAAGTIVDASEMVPAHDRILSVGNGATATISGITIQGGQALTGGGIANTGGDLALTDAVITNNTSDYITSLEGGGGLYSVNGTTTLLRTIVSNNTAWGDGGGISNYEGVLVLRASTVSGNVSGEATTSGTGGGGIMDVSSTESIQLEIFDSTISNNSSANTGGGIDVYVGNLYLSNSTISGNSGRHDGAIAVDSEPSTHTIVASTIANNSSGIELGGSSTIIGNVLANNGSANCPGYLDAYVNDYNLSSDTSCKTVLNGPHNRHAVNPLLGPLASNGGPTQTHALLATSPAIDAGGTSANGCPATDQRGYPRPQGAACDIGAYELLRPPPPAPRPSNVPPADNPPQPAPIPRSNGSIGSARPSPAPMPPSR